jgi:hypothetical protein
VPINRFHSSKNQTGEIIGFFYASEYSKATSLMVVISYGCIKYLHSICF